MVIRQQVFIPNYHICSIIRWVFPSLKWLQRSKSDLPFLNNPKDLDLSYKMDLDFLGLPGMKKICLITEEIWYPKYLLNMIQNKSCFEVFLSKNPQNLDPSSKMDLDFLGSLGGETEEI